MELVLSKNALDQLNDKCYTSAKNWVLKRSGLEANYLDLNNWDFRFIYVACSEFDKKVKNRRVVQTVETALKTAKMIYWIFVASSS